MKKFIFLFLTAMTAASSAYSQCNCPAGTVVLQGDLATQTLTSNNIYCLRGFVRVQAGQTLTIQPGTTILGENSTSGTLIIQRRGKILATGDKFNPIVFTSSKAPGSRASGDWGGIVICGEAKNNAPGGSPGAATVSADPTVGLQIEGNYGAYHGGQRDLDNSGNFQFVRIEYPGKVFSANVELNGLTLGSVGSGTKVDHVQVSFSADDAYEMFGGTVNTRYLVSWQSTDDDFDTDLGYTGQSQFGLAIRNPQIADLTGGSNPESNGFESDNDATGSANIPITRPVYSNYTLVGPRKNNSTSVHPNFGRGAFLRRNTNASIFNSAFIGWGNPAPGLGDTTKGKGLYLNGETTQTNAFVNNTLRFKNNAIFFSGNPTYTKTPYSTAQGSAYPFSTMVSWFNSNANQSFAFPSDAGMQDPFNQTLNGAKLRLNSILRTGAAYNDSYISTFFSTSPTHRGAFDQFDRPAWDSRWTNYLPQNTNNGASCASGARIGLTEEATSSFTSVSPTVLSNENVILSIDLALSSNVAVSLTSLAGVEFEKSSATMESGSHQIELATSGLTSGMYVIKIVAGDKVNTHKIVVQ